MELNAYDSMAICLDTDEDKQYFKTLIEKLFNLFDKISNIEDPDNHHRCSSNRAFPISEYFSRREIYLLKKIWTPWVTLEYKGYLYTMNLDWSIELQPVNDYIKMYKPDNYIDLQVFNALKYFDIDYIQKRNSYIDEAEDYLKEMTKKIKNLKLESVVDLSQYHIPETGIECFWNLNNIKG